MNESASHDAHVLEDLHRAVWDSLPGLEERRAEAGLHVEARREAAELLEAEVRARGGASTGAGGGEGGVIAAVQHLVANLVHDDRSGGAATSTPGEGLAGLERAEAALQARFEAAMADERLSGPARDAAIRAYDLVKPGRDAVRQAALAESGEG